MADFESEPRADGSIVRPSLDVQQRNLDDILEANHQAIINHAGFMAVVTSIHAVSFNRFLNLDGITVQVTRRPLRVVGASRPSETDEFLRVLILSPSFQRGRNNVSSLTVGPRVVIDGERQTIPERDFSLEHAEMIAGMVDELLLARVFGLIPNLDEIALDRISPLPSL